MRIDRNTAEDLLIIFSNAGIPLHVWLPIMHLESSGNPNAHNRSGEDSRGLFQINVRPGASPSWARELGDRLFDPIENAYAILRGDDWLGNRERLNNMRKLPESQQAAYMWKYGIRPRWTSEHERRINYYSTVGLQELKDLYFHDNIEIEEQETETENPLDGLNLFNNRAWGDTETGIPSTLTWQDIFINPTMAVGNALKNTIIRFIVIIFGIPQLILCVYLLLFHEHAKPFVNAAIKASIKDYVGAARSAAEGAAKAVETTEV